MKAGGKQRTASTHVLARVRSLSHLECVGEPLRAVLNDVAHVGAEWLAQQISAEWLERYVHRVENNRLRHPQKVNAVPWPTRLGQTDQGPGAGRNTCSGAAGEERAAATASVATVL